ncbi:MAG: hypothetical protein JW744_03310, partial [Candidatus Diapherotrites archaeon]|nr:hypothetical protein [Candidatus Diapherotrites archaeon]
MARKSRGVVKRASVLLKRAVRKPIDALQAKARARRMALYEKLGIEMEKLFKEHPDRGSKFMEALERLPREMAINAALDRRGILGPEKRAKVKGIMEKIAMRGQQIPAERLEARSDLIVDSHLGELAKTLGPI